MPIKCANAVVMLALMSTMAVAQHIPVDTAAMDAHLRFLASDLLEGRAPATRGGRLAAEYIATQFQALGLEPAGENGTYFQPVALVGMTPQPTLSFVARGVVDSLSYRDEFVAWAERPQADIDTSGEVVFVGFGIRAPEWQWDDYKGANLRGKVLLMLVNDPGLVDSTIFLGKILTYYGRWTYKLEEAARQGAAGAILIHSTESATYPWEVVRGSWSVEQFKLDQPQSPSLAFAGWITETKTVELVPTQGGLDALIGAAARRDFRPLATGVTASVRVRSALRRVESENVAARLPGRGRNERLAAQAVLITAHWDHKGIGPIIRGDSIYNGAEDNASGVAAILGVAKSLTQLPRPARSIVFVSTTAEESGLLGSEAYVQRPLLPLAQTAAVLNLDVTNVRGATRDIGALGMDRSTLGPVFQAAARAESLAAASQPDVRGSFFRSDHFPFARSGVPALSIKPGIDFVGQAKGWGEEQENVYNQQRYHQPSDEYRSTFRYAGLAQQVRVTVRTARAIANDPAMPQWLPSSEFQRADAR